MSVGKEGRPVRPQRNVFQFLSKGGDREPKRVDTELTGTDSTDIARQGVRPQV
jgi:hypothetical protein